MKNLRLFMLCALMISTASYSSNEKITLSITTDFQNLGIKKHPKPMRIKKHPKPMSRFDYSTYVPCYESILKDKITLHHRIKHLREINFTLDDQAYPVYIRVQRNHLRANNDVIKCSSYEDLLKNLFTTN